MQLSEVFKRNLGDHLRLFQQLDIHIDELIALSDVCHKAIDQGGKIVFCGNGGSAADSQHLAAEFVVRFKKERGPVPALALTTDTSILTAHSNDYDFSTVFARQIEALCRPPDVVIGLSTSGNSPNIIEALNRANDLNVFTDSFMLLLPTPRNFAIFIAPARFDRFARPARGVSSTSLIGTSSHL